MKISITLALIAALGAVLPFLAAAETTATVAADGQLQADASYLQRVEPKYLSLAGSHDNLASLASGLRAGGPITLLNGADGSAINFTAPTRPMGYGNITHTLDFATRDLAAAGITSPTAEQLHAALMGGTVTNAAGEATVLPGVLQLRSQGMGWGQIAHALGIPPSPYSKAGLAQGAAGTTAKTAAGRSSGITTAGGSGSAAGTAGKSSRAGIVTAGGDQASSGHAKNGGSANHAGSGIVTAAGTGGNAAFAPGITNAQGGAGVNAGGLAAGRVSTAGGASGHGNAYGKAKD